MGVDKRVVVQCQVGRLTGFYQIFGRLTAESTTSYPPTIENVDMGDHVGTVVFTVARPNYVLYTEQVPA